MIGQRYYILRDRVPAPVDQTTWAQWFENAERRRVRSEEVDGCTVSTVFLGLDHNYSRGGDPVLFETLVFGGPLDGEMRRYCTYDEAERGHAAMVDEVREAKADAKMNSEPRLALWCANNPDKAAAEIERLREAVKMAANRLEIAVVTDEIDEPACKHCIEVALSYLREPT